jgi:acetylornithine deacetylase/succinyl-diaminopimelate desuccinylase-like protein
VLTDRERRVLKLIDDSRDDIVEYLRRLIAFRTITPADGASSETEDYRDLQALVGGSLAEMGFDLETWEVDTAQLDRFPGSGVNPHRDLSNMPVVVGQLKGRG